LVDLLTTYVVVFIVFSDLICGSSFCFYWLNY
jgi:hypothetical protein